MQKIINTTGSILGLLLLAILIFAIVLLLSRPQSATQTIPTRSATQSDIAVTETSPETLVASETVVLPPTATQPQSYPGPTVVPPATATPSPTVVLPPLPTFPPPGPFREMRIIYTKEDPPGYYIASLDGRTEVAFRPVWTSDQMSGIRAQRVSPDGSKHLYTFWDNQAFELEHAISIWTTNADGSDSQLLVTRHDEWFPANAIWSPDGRQIAYWRNYLLTSYQDGAMVGAQELWIMDATGNNQRLVTADAAFSVEDFGQVSLNFRWMNNGYIYFVNTNWQLYAVKPENGQLYLLLNNADPVSFLTSLSPDGQHVAVSSQSESANAQVVETQFESVVIPGDSFVWSLDGQYLAYRSFSTDSSRALGLWLRDIRSREDQLIVADETAAPRAFSPDGRLFSYVTSAGKFVWERETGQARLVIVEPETDPLRPSQFVAWLPVR